MKEYNHYESIEKWRLLTEDEKFELVKKANLLHRGKMPKYLTGSQIEQILKTT